MQDFLVMAVLDRQRDLSEPIEEFIFSHVVFLAIPVCLLEALLDLALQVAVVGVVHHDAQLALLGLVDFAELDDVRVVEHLEDLCLVQRFTALFLAHLRDIDLFDHSERVVRHALHHVRGSEGTHAERADLLVRLELLRWLLRCSLGFDHRV